MDNDASCSIVKTVEKLQTTYTHIYKETKIKYGIFILQTIYNSVLKGNKLEQGSANYTHRPNLTNGLFCKYGFIETQPYLLFID